MLIITRNDLSFYFVASKKIISYGVQERCILLAFISFTSLHIFFSCKKTDVANEAANNLNPNDPFIALNLPLTAYNYANQLLPGYFYSAPVSEQDNTPATNPITDWGATLGRVLFYDKTLSFNNSVACASCHRQSLSFADDKAFSVGFAGALTMRNSMSLVNVKYYRNGKFLWDERGSTLETQTLLPVLDHVEMGMTSLDTLVNRLKTKAYYAVLFHKAFGSQLITSEDWVAIPVIKPKHLLLLCQKIMDWKFHPLI